MRSFYVTLCLLLLVLCGIGYNFWYVNHVSDTMKRMAEALPPFGSKDAFEHVTRMQQYWEKHAAFVGLSVGFPTVDRLFEQISLLCACMECGDLYGYTAARTLLLDCVSDIRRLESFSIGNLL